MTTHNIYKMSFFKSISTLYFESREKRRTKTEVDEIICWLTGYKARMS